MVCQGYLRCSGRYPLLSTQVISRHACATKSSLHAVPASVIAILVTNCRLRESKFQAAPSGRAKIVYSTDYLQLIWWFSQMSTRQDHHHEPAIRVSWSRAYIFIDQTVYQCMYYIYQTRCPSDKHACLGGTLCSIYTWFSRNPSARVHDIKYTVITIPGFQRGWIVCRSWLLASERMLFVPGARWYALQINYCLSALPSVSRWCAGDYDGLPLVPSHTMPCSLKVVCVRLRRFSGSTYACPGSSTTDGLSARENAC